MQEPGPLLAAGRDADIFEYGPRLVLRRSRRGRSMTAEARVMEHARAHGYPVPAIDEVSDDGTELTMERLTGPSMADVLIRQPWTFGKQGAVLADLHRRLHDIAAPDSVGAAPGGAGSVLVHLDLHPLNVVLTGTGPVVIDWSNAARGVGAVDVALTWVLVAAGGIPAGRFRAAALGRVRGLFVGAFLRHFDVAELRPHLPDVVDWKVRDPNMTAAECQAMARLAAANRNS